LSAKLWLAAALAASLSANAAAKGVIGTIPRNNGSVLEVMKRAGCQEGWLSQVLLDSRIKPSEMRRQPRGKVIVLNAESCQNVPPLAARETTRRILRPTVIVRRAPVVTNNRQGEIDALKKRANDAMEEAKTYLTRARSSEEREERLRKELASRAVVVAPKRNGGLILAALAGAVLALALGFVFYRQREGRFAKAPLKKSAGNYNKHLFTLVWQKRSGRGYESRYQCDECGEEIPGDDASLNRHVQEKHSMARMMEPS
jgi:hypothetical protein